MLIKREVQVLVSGAGPVGLVAALFLNRRGVRVAVLDEQMRTAARSYACAIHPRTLELLDELGVANELIARGQRVDSFAYYEGAERKLEVKYSQLGGRFPFLLIVPQPLLEDALERRLLSEGVPVHWSHRLAKIDVVQDKAKVLVHKLEHGTIGYSVSRTAWTVTREDELEVPFVVAADGHRSVVRRQLGIEFPEAGASQLFAVWEFMGEGPELTEARVGLGGGKASVCWPMGQGWYRFGFEVDPGESAEGRPEKSRQIALAGDTRHEYLDRGRLAKLIAERAPWFQIEVKDVAWSMAIRFERRLAENYGRGPVWLLGDATHVAPPVAVQSMNSGLLEAKTLAVDLEAVVRTGASGDRLVAWGKARRSEFEALLTTPVKAGPEATAFAREWAKLVGESLPVSGEDRGKLLAQVGLTT
jgi:2-polyprenyl-6-methoxyphenol hydroxylase-like FAD-dependent oxidoreductase